MIIIINLCFLLLRMILSLKEIEQFQNVFRLNKKVFLNCEMIEFMDDYAIFSHLKYERNYHPGSFHLTSLR